MTLARQFKTLLLFAVAGPPIAAVPLLAFFTIASPTVGFGVGLLGLVFSYPIGVVPAGLAGAVFILLFGKLQKGKALYWNRQAIFLLGAFCGLIGVLFFFILFSILTGTIPKLDTVSGLGIIFFPLSFFSGGICGILSLRLLDEEVSSCAEFKNSQIWSWLLGISLGLFFLLALGLVGLNDKT